MIRKPHQPRFIRLSEPHVAALFGKSGLEARFPISSGRFVARERIAIVGPQGRIDGVAVVGPAAEKTSVSWGEGDIERIGLDTRGVLLIGPQGELKLSQDQLHTA